MRHNRCEKCPAQAAEPLSKIIQAQSSKLEVSIDVLVARCPMTMVAVGVASPVEVRVAWVHHAFAVSRNIPLTIGISGRVCAGMVLIMVPTPLIPMMFGRMVVCVRMMIVLVGGRAHRHGDTEPNNEGENS